MLDYYNKRLDEIKDILELDEFNILKNTLLTNNLEKKQVDQLISKSLNNHFYNKNKREEYKKSQKLHFEILEKKKNSIKVLIDNKYNGYLKSFNNKFNNDLEMAYIKVAKILDIKTVECKRIRFENKNYILEIYDEKKIQKLSNYINKELSSINSENDIKNIVEEPFYYINDKENYFKMIIFYIIINYKNISYDCYGIENNKLSPLYLFINTNKNKDLINNSIIFNNSIIDYKILLNYIFNNYFEYIEKFLYNKFTDENINTIINTINIETNEKENISEDVKNRFIEIKNMYYEKIKIIYKLYNISTTNDLLLYLNQNVEFGTFISVNNEIHKIPFGTIEAEEGKNNKKITYDNPMIINFLNDYYTKNKEKINPTNINITQLLKSISSINDIMTNIYKQNYPLDIFKYNVANSSEQMEFIALFLRIKNIKFKRFVFSTLDSKKMIIGSHFFIAYNKNQKWYYIENSLTDFKGIYEYNCLDDLIDTITSKIIYTKEINPYKQINSNKYILNEIKSINIDSSIEDINELIKKSEIVDINNAIFMYKCENEIRKNILQGNITAYNYKNNYSLIKPLNNFDNENEYKEEYLKLLNENIMNICYKSKDGGYFKVNQIGDKEYEKKEIVITQNKAIKSKKNTTKIKKMLTNILCIVIILVILCIFAHFCGKH